MSERIGIFAPDYVKVRKPRCTKPDCNGAVLKRVGVYRKRREYSKCPKCKKVYYGEILDCDEVEKVVRRRLETL